MTKRRDIQPLLARAITTKARSLRPSLKDAKKPAPHETGILLGNLAGSRHEVRMGYEDVAVAIMAPRSRQQRPVPAVPGRGKRPPARHRRDDLARLPRRPHPAGHPPRPQLRPHRGQLKGTIEWPPVTRGGIYETARQYAACLLNADIAPASKAITSRAASKSPSRDDYGQAA
jgi:hypothetical protein